MGLITVDEQTILYGLLGQVLYSCGCTPSQIASTQVMSDQVFGVEICGDGGCAGDCSSDWD